MLISLFSSFTKPIFALLLTSPSLFPSTSPDMYFLLTLLVSLSPLSTLSQPRSPSCPFPMASLSDFHQSLCAWQVITDGLPELSSYDTLWSIPKNVSHVPSNRENVFPKSKKKKEQKQVVFVDHLRKCTGWHWISGVFRNLLPGTNAGVPPTETVCMTELFSHSRTSGSLNDFPSYDGNVRTEELLSKPLLLSLGVLRGCVLGPGVFSPWLSNNAVITPGISTPVKPNILDAA